MLKLAKQQKQESAETQSQVELQRKHQVDAAIVRIMKARKQLNHQVRQGKQLLLFFHIRANI